MGVPTVTPPLRILLVEDDSDTAEVLGLVLQADGYDVTAVRSAAQALAVFGQLQPEVVLVDVGLPDVNGYDLAARIRAMSACVLIGVSGSEPILDDGDGTIFDAYLMKPVDFARLRAAMTTKAPPATSPVAGRVS